MSLADAQLRVQRHDGQWVLAGAGFDDLDLANDFLAYLTARNYYH
jgi:hypothetical protein